jgi:pentatricopeptide repeat protein
VNIISDKLFNLLDTSSTVVDLDALRCSQEQADIHRTEPVHGKHESSVHTTLHARSAKMQNNDEKMPTIIAATDVAYTESRLDEPLETVECMFNFLLDSETSSRLAMRLAHLMLANDLYAMRGDHDAALKCLNKAEPIVMKFIEWSLDSVNPHSVSFFLECYIRNGNFDHAHRVVKEIMEVVRKREELSLVQTSRLESTWVRSINEAQQTRKERLAKIAKLKFPEIENPAFESSGLDSAINGYFEIIHALKNTA